MMTRLLLTHRLAGVFVKVDTNFVVHCTGAGGCRYLLDVSRLERLIGRSAVAIRRETGDGVRPGARV